MTPQFQYSAKVEQVVDADTVDLLIDLGLRCSVRIRARLYGIDAPERFTLAGREATTFVTVHIAGVRSQVIVKTYKDPIDKYGRWVADLFINGRSLSELLIEAGHAVRKEY